MHAVLQNNVQLVRVLLTHGADVSIGSHEYHTPLSVAVALGYVDAVAFLLERHQLDDDAAIVNIIRALAIAIGRHQDDMTVLEMLLAHGAQVDAHVDESHKTTLHVAASTPNLQAITVLIAHNANVDARDAEGCVALHGAAATKDCALVVKVLIAEGADVDAVDETGITALHIAALLTHACGGGFARTRYVAFS